MAVSAQLIQHLEAFERVHTRLRYKFLPFFWFGEGVWGLCGAWTWAVADAQEVELDDEEAAYVER